MPEAIANGTGRRLMHTRTVECNGYIREDGLWEVEARLVDVKPFMQAADRVRVPETTSVQLTLHGRIRGGVRVGGCVDGVVSGRDRRRNRKRHPARSLVVQRRRRPAVKPPRLPHADAGAAAANAGIAPADMAMYHVR